MTGRIAAIRDRALRSYFVGDPEAGPICQESRAVSEGQPEVIRQARDLAHYLRRQAVTILDGELLVGTRPGFTTNPEAITPQIFGRRVWTAPDPSYWPTPEAVAPFWTEGMLAPAGNHTTLDYTTVFEVGFAGLIERIEERLGRLSADEPEYERKRDFLTALRLVAEGFVDLSDRYADEALRLAEAESDPARAAELRTIAANCRRVPEHPPTTFWEACQGAWFSFFFLPDAPGRVDQYLYPCYERELAAGTLDREFAKELLGCLWVKYFESVGAPSGVSAHNHLTLGGVKPDGSDASSEVTALCLEVTGELALNRPQVGLRWNANTPRPILRKAVEALSSNRGSPDFCNDEQIVNALHHAGASLEDARDFSLSGCHEVIVTGKAQMGSVEGFINMPKLLRMALGLEPGLQSAVAPESLGDFAALWERLEQAMELVAEAAHRSSLGRDQKAAEDPGGNLPGSLVVADCIERCLGYTQGGARYNFCNWDVIGVANLADALVAIQRLVYEEQFLTLPQLIEVLESDWEGYEPLRRRMVNELPHFGNEQPEADDLACRVIETLDGIMKRNTPFRGGCYILGTTAGGENMHIEFGRVTGATPDGRRAGEPLADSIGSVQGRDRKGVTALLNSVARLPHHLLPTATTVNVKLDPKLLDSDEGIESVVSLIDAHFRSGGQQLQFAFVNREILLEAKEHPERYRNLMVRVAGYSAPFTSLWADLQDEIIARTEHAVGC
jgi:trans-4-hydroxy-L-proline dehydratase